MGFWRTEHGIGGDAWADEFDGMMDRLEQLGVERHGGHQITMAELGDLVEFCSRGHLDVQVRHPEDAERPLAKLHQNGVETYPNNGQIHCSEASTYICNEKSPSSTRRSAQKP